MKTSLFISLLSISFCLFLYLSVSVSLSICVSVCLFLAFSTHIAMLSLYMGIGVGVWEQTGWKGVGKMVARVFQPFNLYNYRILPKHKDGHFQFLINMLQENFPGKGAGPGSCPLPPSPWCASMEKTTEWFVGMRDMVGCFKLRRVYIFLRKKTIWCSSIQTDKIWNIIHLKGISQSPLIFTRSYSS